MYQSFKLEPKADIVSECFHSMKGSNLLLEVSLESKENETVEDLIRRCFILFWHEAKVLAITLKASVMMTS